MAATRTNLTTPVGRIVMGSLYKPNTVDAEGKPLTVKNGPNAGQPRTNYFFALAIPKGAEQHWAQTAWGAPIWQVGNTAFPNAAQSPSFAWKIEDGDSAIPNKRGKKPIDNEGWKGHWILKFSGGFAPKVYKQENGAYVQILEADFVKPGHYVQVAGTVDGNGSQSQPGIYLNHSMVCFAAYGQEIVFGMSPEDAGFGGAPLPAGASVTPPASSIPMPGTGTGSAAPVPTPSSAPAVPVMPVPATVAAPVVVTPNPQFLQVNPTVSTPVVPVPVPTIPAPVPPSSVPQMTAKAGGASYQAFISGGWSHERMLAEGYVTV